MAKELDNKKMWESFIEYKGLPIEMRNAIHLALEDQGLKWNGKEIVEINETSDFKIEAEIQGNQVVLKKKELKKVEPKFKVGDIIRHKEQGCTCKITAVDAEYGVFKCYGTHLPFDFQDAWELVEQKSAWSEEDEWYIEQLNSLIDGYAVEDDKPNLLKNWLKFLKSRVQPQPKHEWSEEDEKMLESCIGAIGAADYYTFDDKMEMEKWLKSLKYREIPQKQWKPSEEELNKAAVEWDRKASFSPIAMALDSTGNPNGTKTFATSHADSFKSGVEWVLKQLKAIGGE